MDTGKLKGKEIMRKNANRPRYSKSRDGIDRCTISVQFRLTRDEYTKLSLLAEIGGNKSVSKMFEYSIPLISLISDAESLSEKITKTE
jgi:hypothetical protein